MLPVQRTKNECKRNNRNFMREALTPTRACQQEIFDGLDADLTQLSLGFLPRISTPRQHNCVGAAKVRIESDRSCG
jgi:hypothetical protein